MTDNAATATALMDDDSGPLYPDIKIQLTGLDGNSFSIIGRCLKACDRGDIHPEDVANFKREVLAGDYGHLLRTCIKWFECY